MNPTKPRITALSFVGRPLAGKDFQAAKLQDTYAHTTIISPGALLRDQNLLANAGFTQEDIDHINKTRDSGGLVNDRYTMPLMRAAIEQRVAEGNSMLIFTGYPRSLDQFEDLQKFKQDGNIPFDMQMAYVHFDIGVWGVLKRRRKRWKEEHRNDDRGFRRFLRRQRVFRKNVLPVVDEVKKSGEDVLRIDARKSKDEITKQLEAVLKPFLPEKKSSTEGVMVSKER